MPQSPFGHPHAQGKCYATWYVKKKARELTGHFGFTSSDRDDLEQSLFVSLMERWPKFHADECTPQEFISWAIGRGVADLIRERQQRNAAEPTEGLPLEELFKDEDEQLPTGCVQADHVPSVELSLDVEHILSRLPSEIQDTARRLMEGNVCQVARQTGLSRRTIRDRARIIREAFEAAGYGAA